MATKTTKPVKKTSKKTTKKASKSTKAATAAKQRDTDQRDATSGGPDGNDGRQEKRMSLLDAAAHLLSLGTRDPMRCKDIVDLAVERGLWQPRNGGKTPANTLNAAIAKEIKTKGDDSRFVKVERGKYARAGKS
jgi:hypothetical protein